MIHMVHDTCDTIVRRHLRSSLYSFDTYPRFRGCLEAASGAYTMPIAHRVADDEKFAIIVITARPVRMHDGSGTSLRPLPRFLIAMIRGPFTMGALDSFMYSLGVYEHARGGADDSGSDEITIPAAHKHFGPCVTVETRGLSICRANSASGEVEYLTKTFSKHQLIDGYSFYVASHYINQLLHRRARHLGGAWIDAMH